MISSPIMAEEAMGNVMEKAPWKSLVGKKGHKAGSKTVKLSTRHGVKTCGGLM